MSLWFQHLLVLLIVGGCLFIVGRQGVRTLLGRKSRLGACCAKGCTAVAEEASKKPQAANRVVFFPSEMLTASSRRPRS